MTIRAHPKPPYTADEYDAVLARWLKDELRAVDDLVIELALRIAIKVTLRAAERDPGRFIHGVVN